MKERVSDACKGYRWDGVAWDRNITAIANGVCFAKLKKLKRVRKFEISFGTNTISKLNFLRKGTLEIFNRQCEFHCTFYNSFFFVLVVFFERELREVAKKRKKKEEKFEPIIPFVRLGENKANLRRACFIEMKSIFVAYWIFHDCYLFPSSRVLTLTFLLSNNSKIICLLLERSKTNIKLMRKVPSNVIRYTLYKIVRQ